MYYLRSLFRLVVTDGELGLRWALSVNAAAVACLVTWSGRRLRVMRERRRTVRRWIEKERRRLE